MTLRLTCFIVCVLLCRYLPFLIGQLSSVLGREEYTRLQVVNANHHPNCLAMKGLESVFGYNFNGTTDVLLAHSQAAQSGQPETGSVAALKVKKDRVRCSYGDETCFLFCKGASICHAAM